MQSRDEPAAMVAELDGACLLIATLALLLHSYNQLTAKPIDRLPGMYELLQQLPLLVYTASARTDSQDRSASATTAKSRRI